MQGNLNLNPNPSQMVKQLQSDLMHCFQSTLPSKQFSAELVLGIVQLNLWAREMERTTDLAIRRELRDQFEHGYQVIKQAMELLWEKVWRPLDHGITESSSAQNPSRSDSALRIVR